MESLHFVKLWFKWVQVDHKTYISSGMIEDMNITQASMQKRQNIKYRYLARQLSIYRDLINRDTCLDTSWSIERYEDFYCSDLFLAHDDQILLGFHA